MGADLLLTLLFGLLDRANQIGTLIQTAKNEGRDVTVAELDALSTGAQDALDKLAAEIAAAKAAST